MEYYCESMKNTFMYVIHPVPCTFHVYEYDNNIICHKKGCTTLLPLYLDQNRNNNIECPCHSYCPQGNISPQKYFNEFIYNIYTTLLNLVSLLVNCCKLRKWMN